MDTKDRTSEQGQGLRGFRHSIEGVASGYENVRSVLSSLVNEACRCVSCAGSTLVHRRTLDLKALNSDFSSILT